MIQAGLCLSSTFNFGHIHEADASFAPTWIQVQARNEVARSIEDLHSHQAQITKTILRAFTLSSVPKVIEESYRP